MRGSRLQQARSGEQYLDTLELLLRDVAPVIALHENTYDEAEAVYRRVRGDGSATQEVR